MDVVADNAPLFVLTFLEACADFKQQGYKVPTVSDVNSTLWRHRVGYQIERQTIMRSSWVRSKEKGHAKADMRLSKSSVAVRIAG